MTWFFFIASLVASIAYGTKTSTPDGFMLFAGGLVITGIAYQVEKYLDRE
jgi:hypothetical protein